MDQSAGAKDPRPGGGVWGLGLRPAAGLRGKAIPGGPTVGLAAVGDVVADGAGIEHRLLPHQSHVAVEGGVRVGGNRGAVEQDAAVGGVIPALKQRDTRALARAALADQGHDLPWLDREGDAAQDEAVGARRVGERNPAELDAADEALALLVGRGVGAPVGRARTGGMARGGGARSAGLAVACGRYLRLAVHQVKDLVCGACGRHEPREDVADAAQGVRQALLVQDKGDLRRHVRY